MGSTSWLIHCVVRAGAVLTYLIVVHSQPALAREAMRLSATLDGPATAVQAVAFSPDGRWIAAATQGATQLWEAQRGRLVRILDGPTNALAHGLAFAPTGERLASIVDDHTVAIWRIESGERLLSLKAQGHDLASLAYSSDGARIVTASHSGLIEAWNAQGGERLRAVYCPDFDLGDVLAVTVTPDGKIISVGNEVCTWKEDTGALLSTEDPHGQAIAASADGNWIGVVTTPSPFFLVKIWSVRANKIFGYLGLGRVATLGFSSDGARLCSGGDRLSLWDLTTPELVSIHEIRSGYTTHYSFTACAFSPDRRRLVAADSEHHRLMIWDVD
jgi:WD40 repeat protein